MNTLSRIPVVFSRGHNFGMPTSVAMLSMLESSLDVADIFILQSEDVNDDDCKNLNDIISSFPASSIQYISLAHYFSGAFEIRGISKEKIAFLPWKYNYTAHTTLSEEPEMILYISLCRS